MDSQGGFGPLSVLVPHSGDAAGLALRAGARRASSGRADPALDVRFVLEGKLSGLRLNAAAGGELWQHTCFEVFARPSGMPAYLEFNFSLDGRWRAYSFASYRNGGPMEGAGFAPTISIEATGEQVQLDARVPVQGIDAAGALEVGLSAVLESRDGALAYWALRHPPGKPDFHHDDAFALRLDALRN